MNQNAAGDATVGLPDGARNGIILSRIGQALGLTGTDLLSTDAVESRVDEWIRAMIYIARAVGEKETRNPAAIVACVERLVGQRPAGKAPQVADVRTHSGSVPLDPSGSLRMVVHPAPVSDGARPRPEPASDASLQELEVLLEAQLNAVRTVRGLLKTRL
jgi:hypothetical protein